MKITNVENGMNKEIIWNGVAGLFEQQNPHFIKLIKLVQGIAKKADSREMEDVEEVIEEFEKIEEPLIKICSYNSSKVKAVNKCNISERCSFEVEILDEEILSDLVVSYRTYLLILKKISATKDMTIADMCIMDKTLDVFHNSVNKLVEIQSENAQKLSKEIFDIDLGD